MSDLWIPPKKPAQKQPPRRCVYCKGFDYLSEVIGCLNMIDETSSASLLGITVWSGMGTHQLPSDRYIVTYECDRELEFWEYT